MRLLLTSAGIKNATIRNALVDLLGKPIAESSALCPWGCSNSPRYPASTAIKVTDGTVEVVSEGTGSCLPPLSELQRALGLNNCVA